MQRKVLDYLCEQGGLGLFAFPQSSVDYKAINEVAKSINGNASFVVLDFSYKSKFHLNHLKTFFRRPLTNEEIQFIKDSKEGLTFYLLKGHLRESEESFRIFYKNLELVRKVSPFVFAILPDEIFQEQFKRISSIAKFIVIAGDNPNAAAAYLEDYSFLGEKPLLWLFDKLPNKKNYKKAYQLTKVCYSRCYEFHHTNLKKNPTKFAKNLTYLIKAEILKKNPLDGFYKIFRNFYLLFILFVILLPFLIPSNVDIGVSHVRERGNERDKLSLSPSFLFEFDGKESMQRIGRYGIGRFMSLITNEKMVHDYVKETLKENGYPENFGEKGYLNIPPKGTVIKFSRPDFIEDNPSDSISNAWRYWTHILSDSIAYLTEFYHEKATADYRQHNGIDLASHQGARILAPFTAKAYSSKDERGGVIIGLVREKDVVLFMHCDKLLYLDGQDVMQGDPIATVGVTGHTTGPHAHVVTGLIDKNGPKKIGNVRYKVIDPIKWYYLFKPSSF